MSSETPRRWVSKRELAARYRVSERTIERYVAERGLPCYRPFETAIVRFDIDACDEWMQGSRSRIGRDAQQEADALRVAARSAYQEARSLPASVVRDGLRGWARIATLAADALATQRSEGTEHTPPRSHGDPDGPERRTYAALGRRTLPRVPPP